MDRLVTTGTLSIDNTKLAGFDIGKKMASIEKFAGIKGGPDTEIQNFGATLRMDPEGITADRLQLIVPALGSVEGSGTSSAAHVLDFKMRATVHTSGLLAPVGGTPSPSRCKVPQRTGVPPRYEILRQEEIKRAITPDNVGKAAGFVRGSWAAARSRRYARRLIAISWDRLQTVIRGPYRMVAWWLIRGMRA